MSATKFTAAAVTAITLLFAACATSPEVEARRQAIEADIADILSAPLDPAEFGETRRCLADRDYRNFRALDDRRIVFEGRRGRLWINTLRSRCPDLRHGDVLVMNRHSSSRICDKDRFEVAEWFSFPWYRRWPWAWGDRWGTGMACALGEFQPVTAAQVREIEAVLRAR